jgi:hypothetical protein
MAETVGSLVDKITIADLKIFHMGEQTRRGDATDEHIAKCKQRLEVMALQRDDLLNELDRLIKDVFSGKVRLKMYRQFKMYNDPKYGIKAK